MRKISLICFQRISGFSLIELMIVVSIVGILTVICIPSYQHYTQRARFVEVITATEPYKTAVAIAIQSGVPISDLSNGMHGIPLEPKSTKNIASIKVDNGIVTAIATDLISGSTYILKPSNDGTNWAIAGSCIKNGLCNA